MIWKCTNVTVWLLDDELLDLMKKSGSYQMTVSIESGNQYVLDRIIKKPLNLKKTLDIVAAARERDFEIIANFVIGFPHETWGQIRETFAYAEVLKADLVNSHIATPLPKTELMDVCVREGYVSEREARELKGVSYTKGVIATEEFTPQELQILRAYEWDRINFRSEERMARVATIQGISADELTRWRKETRRKLGVVDKELVAG